MTVMCAICLVENGDKKLESDLEYFEEPLK